MDESSVYNESDLAPFRRRLNDLHAIIKSDSETGKHSVAMTRLLERQLGECGPSSCLMSYGVNIPHDLSYLYRDCAHQAARQPLGALRRARPTSRAARYYSAEACYSGSQRRFIQSGA
jgi:hypothetical protein